MKYKIKLGSNHDAIEKRINGFYLHQFQVQLAEGFSEGWYMHSPGSLAVVKANSI